VGSPDAVAAAQKAEKPNDRFSLSSLSHLFQGPATYNKAVDDSTSYPAYSSPMYSSSPSSMPS
jgi:hypothetical protein